MRNPSKNTIKQIMRKAKDDQKTFDCYFFDRQSIKNAMSEECQKAYFLFNNVGARLYTMSKGRICNRGLMGISKYVYGKGD